VPCVDRGGAAGRDRHGRRRDRRDSKRRHPRTSTPRCRGRPATRTDYSEPTFFKPWPRRPGGWLRWWLLGQHRHLGGDRSSEGGGAAGGGRLAASSPLLIAPAATWAAQSSNGVIRGLEQRQRIQAGPCGARWAAKRSLGLLLGPAAGDRGVPGPGRLGRRHAGGHRPAGISLVCITTWRPRPGRPWPLLFHRLGLESSLMSLHSCTTAKRRGGVFIYLQTASWLLKHVGPDPLKRWKSAGFLRVASTLLSG